MKLTTKSSDGTSFHNIMIKTTVQKLIDTIGHPQYFQNTGNDKVNFEWICETKSGDVVTIYDWKEYRPLGYDEEILFHLGGRTQLHTIDGLDELMRLINDNK